MNCIFATINVLADTGDEFRPWLRSAQRGAAENHYRVSTPETGLGLAKFIDRGGGA